MEQRWKVIKMELTCLQKTLLKIKRYQLWLKHKCMNVISKNKEQVDNYHSYSEEHMLPLIIMTKVSLDKFVSTNIQLVSSFVVAKFCTKRNTFIDRYQIKS
ncbi:uncharacterized protein LOC117648608 [Thrips palmi]|uniref:Uncharacterized protein LOC117648608 n=1 Tax=Thrips palmi TaxID=161013 RepID=A0A6P8ZR69_THRPL|nr:uncharacterized protein LOC117648608 [Thrips palmi]